MVSSWPVEWLRRFNPFGVGETAPIDPRRMSAVLGALGALEAFAGAVLALPLLLSVLFALSWAIMRPYQRQHHLHQVHVGMLVQLGLATALSAAFWWAGVALVIGHRSRYRAQGALVLALGGAVVWWALRALIS